MDTINSHNEWDELEEVIVGDGFPSSLPAIELSFKIFFNDNLSKKWHKFRPENYITKQILDEHAEDVERFAELLKSHNIIVKRPKKINKIHRVKTPWWESTDYPALNVRDMCMVVGNTIIETPPTCRYRYFENDYLKHLFLEYFKNGNCNWITAPKPVMTDRSFDIQEYELEDEFHINDNYMDMGNEIMFDAANCVRLGTDIIMNVDNDNQRLGAKWLQRVLGSDYKVWEVSVTDSHIDSSFLPLKPGVGLVMRPDIPSKLPEWLQKWNLIYIPLRERTEEQNVVKLASPRIELNVLSLSPETIICHSEYESILNKELNKYGIKAIGTPFRHCELFSGAHHCTTLDVRRKSRLEKYS